jgi:hypothetical protein
MNPDYRTPVGARDDTIYEPLVPGQVALPALMPVFTDDGRRIAMRMK